MANTKKKKPQSVDWSKEPMVQYSGDRLKTYAWSPEHQIANELQYFEGKDILPRRVIPSPEEIAKKDVMKEHPDYKALAKKQKREKKWFGTSKISLQSQLEKQAKKLALTDKIPLPQELSGQHGGLYDITDNPDEYLYHFSDGEIGEINVDEYHYLHNAKGKGDREKREKMVRTVGAGVVNPKTGRKQYFIITTGLLLAAGIGAAAKVVGGAIKRHQEKKAHLVEKKQINEKIAEVGAEKVKAGVQAGRSVQDIQQYNKLRKQSEFDSFTAEAEKAIVPQGAYVKKQKGLQTGAGEQAEDTVMAELNKQAKFKDESSVMVQNQTQAKNVQTMDEIKTSTDKIIASLRRGEEVVNNRIKQTGHWTNYAGDAVSGASMGVNLYSGMGGGGST